jgi:antitoxin ParD1/3/4
MSISAELGSQLENYVTDLVKAGRYHSKNEVLQEGVRLVQEREECLKNLDNNIDQGLKSLKKGHIQQADAVFDRLSEKYQAMADLQKL